MHPREFGDFRILKLLPLGGMGRVYLAHNTRTGRPVALKLIERGTDRERMEIVEAERRGATLQERLCGLDPRIVCVLSFGEVDDYFYIEMDYVEGEDLSEVLTRGPLGVPFAARIGRDLCDALNAAHTFTGEIDGHKYHGVVHGDIKPRNIRITPHGDVRVLDFGIAKALSLTRQFTQNQFASSQYSSPERLNTGDVNVASDLWSVGVVLYEVVTARPYFEAENGPRLDHLIRNYNNWRPLPASLPAGFQAILRKSLHPDPGFRYRSAMEFRSDLDGFLTGRITGAETVAAGFDSEKTRRTTPVMSDEAPTRRTVPANGAVRPAAAEQAPAPARRRSFAPAKMRHVAALLLLFAMIAAGAVAYNEYDVWQDADQLRREIESERLTDLNDAWKRYQVLEERNHLPLVLRGTRNAMLNRMIANADRVIREYRSYDAPSVTEGDWVRARASLARALELDPGNREIRGRMYLADGHINRIRGSSRVNGKMLNEARSKFEQAATLLPKSPDPYLGLARLYVYSLKDVERAEEALKAAGKRGHDMGRREKAQLADGYRERAERLLNEANRAIGLPEEKDFLERARSDFRRAQEYYRDILPFGSSADGLRAVNDNSDHVNARLQIIREGA